MITEEQKAYNKKIKKESIQETYVVASYTKEDGLEIRRIIWN